MTFKNLFNINYGYNNILLKNIKGAERNDTDNNMQKAESPAKNGTEPKTFNDSSSTWNKIMEFYQQAYDNELTKIKLEVTKPTNNQVHQRDYYDKKDLLAMGFSENDINTYFVVTTWKKDNEETTIEKYTIKKNLYVEGEHINNVESLLKAKNNKAEIKETIFSGGLYKKEDLLTKGLSEDELNKYFTEHGCSNNGTNFIAYTLKNNFYVNGTQILNVDILLKALQNNSDVQEIGENSEKMITNDLCINSKDYFLSKGLSENDLNKYFIQVEAKDSRTGDNTLLYRLKRNLYVNGEKINDLQTLLKALQNKQTIDEIQIYY